MSVEQQILGQALQRVAAKLPRRPRRVTADSFHPAYQIVSASSHARRAEILLRLPDTIVLERSGILTQACEQAGFVVGATFLAIREAALAATRTRDGRLPEQHTRVLEIWRDGLVSLARGE